MTIAPGTRLGPYEISARLGAGGMGEVWRATDTRLQRDVAIKVLPAEFAQNAQLRARFEREAKSISALNHPHICTLHDVGSEGGVEFLVMELVEGESLADRLGRGPMPPDLVLKTAIEIADALDKAHRRGIVHRDLKPGNVMLTKSGAKLLDFGLAKAAEPVAVSQTSATVQMPHDKPLTAEGMIVGTFQYMAPEQLEGQQVDHRSDLFAFGAMVYEMATGKRAFAGKSRASTIALILDADPPPISTIAPATPPALDRVVRTCLAKDPEDRFQTAHDVMVALQWIREERSSGAMPAARRRVGRERVAWIAAAVMALAAIGAFVWSARRAASQSSPPVRLSMLPPEGGRFLLTGDYGGGPAVSRDGRAIAFIATNASSRRSLWVRTLDDPAPRELAGTNEARFPFWSPDGKSLGFFSGNKLRTIDVAGGVPVAIADVADPRGGTWGDDNTIVYAPFTREGLYRVPANGGTPVRLTTVTPPMTTHRWPLFLPGAKAILYLDANHNELSAAATALHFRTLDGKIDKVLVHTFANAAYANGRLLFMREETLFAQPFDVDSGTLSGRPAVVAEHVRFDAGTWRGLFDVSQHGALAYQGGSFAGAELTVYDRGGHVIGTLGERDRYHDVAVSPDGKMLATTIGEPKCDIWLIDLATGARTRLSYEGGGNIAPIWSADGKEIFYSAGPNANAASVVYRRPVAGGVRQLFAAIPGQTASVGVNAVTTDGRVVVTAGPVTKPQAMLLTAGAPPIPLACTPPCYDGTLSPDEKWVAFTGADGGTEEVFVIPFPTGEGKWQVSTAGGHFPRWTRDGTLYYVTPDNALVATPVKTNNGQPVFGVAKPLFRIETYGAVGSVYDVTPDGRVIVPANEADSTALTFVSDWIPKEKE